MFLGWSSRTYPLDAADFAAVEDYSGPEIPAKDLPGDEVVLLIRRGRPDALLRGREAVRAAGDGVVDVRIVFEPSIAKWNLLFTLVRPLRNMRRFKCSQTYHIAPEAVRQMGLERAVRTLDDPHARGKIEKRRAKMAKLKESLSTTGYDDSFPINVMLCRSCGVEDSLRQGHHRISACLECGVQKMAVCFSAAGALPRVFRRIAAKPPLGVDVLRNAIESRLGEPIAKFIPVDGTGKGVDFIAVPKSGGRIGVKLLGDLHKARRLVHSCVPDDGDETTGVLNGGEPVMIGGRFVLGFRYSRWRALHMPLAMAVGLAPALLLPVLVVGALAIDVAVMRTACGERSLVAWSQFGAAGLSALLMAVLAVIERRSRVGYAFMAVLFAAMAAYELLREVLNVGGRAVSVVAVCVVVAAGVAAAVFAKRSAVRGIKRVVASRSFLALPFAFVSIWGVSKLVSMRAIWGALHLSADEVASVRRVVEEGTELLGYAVILCWAVSFFFGRIAEWRRSWR